MTQLIKLFSCSRKLEPSALIYEDKTDTCSSSHSAQNTTKDTVKLVESTYLDKLRKSVEDKMIDNFVSQVIDKCVADIQIDSRNVDRTGAASNGTHTKQNSEASLVNDVSNAKDHTCDIEEQRHNATDTEQNSEVRTLGQNDKSEDPTGKTEQHKDSANLIDHVQENVHGNLVDHLYCASGVEEYQDNKHSVTDNGVENNLERNSDHNYCVNDSTNSDTTVIEELSDSNSVCKVVLNADECSSDHAVIDDLQNVGDTFKDCYCLMEEGEYFIDKSNVSRPDYTDLEFIELEVSDETCKTEVDAECTPEINLGCETEMETEVINDADVDSDANSSLLFQFSKENDNINLSKKITEEMPAPVCTSMDLNCGVLNPQGVTYMVSPKSDATAMTSTWKQNITSPDCTKNTFQLPKAEEIVEVAYKDCQANLERDPGRKSNSDCLDQLSVNSVQHTSLVTEKTGSDDTDRLSVKDTVSVKVCDAYVQSKPDLRSATNSPFVPYDTHSASTSPFVPYETHSATTSPFIPYAVHTTSVNTDIVETADAEVGTELPPTIYVNIIKDQPEVKSISVSTDESFDTETETGTCLNRSVDLITKESISLNKEINHDNAVSASTDLPDYSMKNTMTETADIGVGAIVDTVDIGVEVQPTVVTVSTEMTELPMSTVGTSMTPLKMQHKNGKR